MEIGKQGEIGTNPWFGYDLRSQSVVNMKDKGIIDPLKVTRNALLNASSIAGTILLTECVVIDLPQDNNNNPADMMSNMMM
jgi:chaperonin GroEL (HSP60 family)